MNVADRVYGVSELTREIKGALETSFPPLWLKGELSNVLVARSGHLYLTLKDDQAAIKGVMWRGNVQKLIFRPEDGAEVLVFGRLSVYEPRGEYQIVLEAMQPAGRGALAVEFEKLKEKLAAEGLFNLERKLPLPESPQRIGVVTSDTGAAVRDMLVTLARRGLGIEVVLAPAQVQGQGASESIVRALQRLEAMDDPPDLILLGRGGGSLEDLWAFNEEATVRAVAACTIPIISGVGHETDTTLTDFVADLRAPTPTGAAELATPDKQETRRAVEAFTTRLGRATWNVVERLRQRIENLSGAYGLRRVPDRIEQHLMRLDDLQQDAERGLMGRMERLDISLDRYAERMTALSPLKVLERGYSVVRSGATVIRDAAQLIEGQEVELLLRKGEASARVEQVRPARKGRGERE